MNQSELNAALAADDQLEISKLQESLEYIKNCSNKVIDYVVFELETELKERDLARQQLEGFKQPLPPKLGQG